MRRRGRENKLNDEEDVRELDQTSSLRDSPCPSCQRTERDGRCRFSFQGRSVPIGKNERDGESTSTKTQVETRRDLAILSQTVTTLPTPFSQVALTAIMDFKWEENERVLCYHGPLIYEAKVGSIPPLRSLPSLSS